MAKAERQMRGSCWVIAVMAACGCAGEAAGTAGDEGASSSASDGTGGTSSTTADPVSSDAVEPSSSTSSGVDDSSSRTALPEEVGPGVEMGYAPPASCCSRRLEPVSWQCPPGANKSNEGTFDSVGDVVSLSETPNTLSGTLEVQALVTPSDGEVTVLLTETDHLPPAGVLDLSPVFRVDSDSALPPMALLLPLTSNQTSFSFESVGVYFSSDGERFTLIGDSRLNAGFMQATLLGTGFVFAGSVATGADCGSL